MALHQYSYQACDASGAMQTGEISAENEQEVVANLQSRQLIPIKVTQKADKGTSSLLQLSGSKFSTADLIEFTNGLCTLIAARIPIDRALGLLEGLTEKAAAQKLIADLRQDVKEGKSLADALQAHPDVFSPMYVNMVHAGEEGGILEQLLPKLADFLSVADEAKRIVASSLIYPAFLLVVGIASVVLLLVFMVPQFALLFEDVGDAVPPSAAFLLAASDWLKNYGWTLLGIPVLVWFGWQQMGVNPERQLKRDQFLLNLPLYGSLMLQAESSRFCRTLGSLLGAGIPLLKALHIVRGVMSNRVLTEVLAQTEEAVRGGASLGKSLGSHKKFPVLLSQLIVVGEESGRTAVILDQLAETFDKNVKQQTARLVAMVQPLLTMLLGVLVGSIVIIMLSAVYSVTQLNY